jgi:histidine kinase-like protein
MSLGDALNQSYPAVPETVPLLRRALTDVAAAAGAGGERLEEIRLAVTEALTNAVVHAYRDHDGGQIHLTAAVASGSSPAPAFDALVDVTDRCLVCRGARLLLALHARDPFTCRMPTPRARGSTPQA